MLDFALNRGSCRTLAAAWLSSALLLAGVAGAAVNPDIGERKGKTATASAGPVEDSGRKQQAAPDGSQTQRIVRKGVVVEFKVSPIAGKGMQRELTEGEWAEVEFRVTSEQNDEPLQGVYPGVWVDLAKLPASGMTGAIGCKERVGMYLQGLVGIRPMIDLNSYYVLALNSDATISVLDPVVGITGLTSLYAMIRLKDPGVDWAKTGDEKRLFVSMPGAGEVAVVDLDTFKVTDNVPVGDTPLRIALQPDDKYVWVGMDAKQGKDGITVIDAQSRQVAANIATGEGHHEIAFSGNDRYAFVSNRDAGTVSVIDIATLKKVRDIRTGPVPIALAVSPLSKSLYVVDAKTGVVTVIDSETLKTVGRIEARAGLGALRFSEDGRWGVMVNPVENEVYVIDASTDRITHTVAVADKPYRVQMTRAFAYIRALDSARVSMINLTELGNGGELIVNTFAAGTSPPGRVEDFRLADGIVPALLEAAVLVVSPADATIYYYMEGMNSPMGAFRNYGRQPRAVEIASRALKEKQPGIYAATVRIPAAGTFEVAYLNETPQFLHCFTFEARANPSFRSALKPMAIDYLLEQRRVPAGDTLQLRFRLTNPSTGQARPDLKDVRVKYFRAPSYDLTEVSARHVGEGIYEAALPIPNVGAYYVYVAAPSVKMGYGDLSYMTLRAVKKTTASTPAQDRRGQTTSMPSITR